MPAGARLRPGWKQRQPSPPLPPRLLSSCFRSFCFFPNLTSSEAARWQDFPPASPVRPRRTPPLRAVPDGLAPSARGGPQSLQLSPAWAPAWVGSRLLLLQAPLRRAAPQPHSPQRGSRAGRGRAGPSTAVPAPVGQCDGEGAAAGAQSRPHTALSTSPSSPPGSTKTHQAWRLERPAASAQPHLVLLLTVGRCARFQLLLQALVTSAGTPGRGPSPRVAAPSVAPALQ